MGWNYLSIPKLQRCNRWSLRMDKLFHPIHYNGCNYLSMLGLKLNHVSKRGPRSGMGAVKHIFPVLLISIFRKSNNSDFLSADWPGWDIHVNTSVIGRLSLVLIWNENIPNGENKEWCICNPHTWKRNATNCLTMLKKDSHYALSSNAVELDHNSTEPYNLSNWLFSKGNDSNTEMLKGNISWSVILTEMHI